jgi:Transposase domain (DUF772)
MRGDDNQQEGMFSYLSPQKRVPADHPLRPIRKMVDEILKEMSPRFAKLYSDVGRPSIAPERLLRSLLLQIFYSVRSERMLIEQLQYNLLFRWFVGMEMDEAVPYWSGRGGITPPGGNTWSPTDSICNNGVSSGSETLGPAMAFCTSAPQNSSVWFPDLRRDENFIDMSILVKF